MVAHVHHSWRTMTHSATLEILELWQILKAKIWVGRFLFFILLKEYFPIMRCVSLCIINGTEFAHSSSQFDQNVGSPLPKRTLAVKTLNQLNWVKYLIFKPLQMRMETCEIIDIFTINFGKFKWAFPFISPIQADSFIIPNREMALSWRPLHDQLESAESTYFDF